MQKSDVIEFFDRCAPTWDAGMIKNDTIIGKILDNAEVGPGMDVLDVACGTGVMFDYYLDRNVASVTGIDISPEMAKIAAAKYADNPLIRSNFLSKVVSSTSPQMTWIRGLSAYLAAAIFAISGEMSMPVMDATFRSR